MANAICKKKKPYSLLYSRDTASWKGPVDAPETRHHPRRNKGVSSEKNQD